MIRKISFAFALLALFATCEDPDPSELGEGDDKKYILITATGTTVKVGSNKYITVKVQVPLDGTGETCTFTTTSGTFESKTSNKTSTTAVVDIDGYATTTWFAPQTSGTQKITATIKTLFIEQEIIVEPVGAITYENFPTTIAVNTTQLITITAGADWAGAALEVKTTGGMLEATGPASEDFEKGTKIRPILDETGKAQVIYTSPAAAGDLQITSSLYGTFSTGLIKVQ
jgi:hypothetical protein